MSKILLKRYPGAKSFSTDEKDLFFGRDPDIEKLSLLVGLKKTLVIHSKSGIGKSSLLNAGLIPRLSKSGNYIFMPVRFLACTAENSRSPYQKIVDELNKNEVKPNFLNKLVPTHNSLWYYFKNLQINGGDQKTFLLIFDQFEELFTYSDYQIHEFKKQLSDLLYTKIPLDIRHIVDGELKKEDGSISNDDLNILSKQTDVKVLFLIRSDRMSYLDKLKDSILTIMDFTYELESLTIEHAKLAIVEPAGKTDREYFSKPFVYEEKAVDKIINYLTQNDQKKIATFELQIICNYIEDNLIERQDNGRDDGINEPLRKTKVNKTDLDDIDGIIKNFYDNLISQIDSPDERLQARRLIEEQLIREDRRIPFDISVCLQYIHQETLDKLVKEHLLSSEQNSTGGFSYEIIHDTLIAPILNSYKLRKKEEESIERERRYAEEMAENERRYAAEMAENERKHAAHILEAKAEYERTERIKERKKQRLVIILISLIATISIAFAFYASKQKGILVRKKIELDSLNTSLIEKSAMAESNAARANYNSKIAYSLAESAKEERVEAQKQRNIAISQRDIAKLKTRDAEKQRMIADSLARSEKIEKRIAQKAKYKSDSLYKELFTKQKQIDSLINMAITTVDTRSLSVLTIAVCKHKS